MDLSFGDIRNIHYEIGCMDTQFEFAIRFYRVGHCFASNVARILHLDIKAFYSVADVLFRKYNDKTLVKTSVMKNDISDDKYIRYKFNIIDYVIFLKDNNKSDEDILKYLARAFYLDEIAAKEILTLDLEYEKNKLQPKIKELVKKRLEKIITDYIKNGKSDKRILEIYDTGDEEYEIVTLEWITEIRKKLRKS